MVPKGWVKQTFKNLLSSGDIIGIQDGNHGNEHPKSADYVESGIPFVMARDLKRGTIDFNNCSYITKSQADSLRIGFAKTGDVLLSHKGTIGEVAIVPKGYEYVMLTPQVTYYRLNPSGCLYYEYLFHYFLGDKYQSIFKTLATQSTRSYLGITAQKELEIDVPPLAEQIIIAKILSTWDQAISTTEQLLANSQQQKKALMQQLLTGKKRLLDKNGVRFSGEWKHGRLGELCTLKGGSAFKEEYQGLSEGDLPFVKVSDMNLKGNDKYIIHANNWIANETAKLIKAQAFPKDAIVFAKVGAALLLNRRRVLLRPTIIDNNMMAATPTKLGDASFLYQLMLAIDFAKFVQDGAVPSVNQGDLASFKISYPELEEQQKIASVLTAADQEIATLQRKLDCLKQEKKALMQQLLTGKRRVLVN